MRVFGNLMVVIILTLVFDFFCERNQKFVYIYIMVLMLCLVFLIGFWTRKRWLQKKIIKTFPNFLNQMIVSMEIGRSFQHAFQKNILHQTGHEKDFYELTYQKIFVLREPKSGFFCQEWDIFYKFLYQISTKPSYQIEAIKQYRQNYLRTQHYHQRLRALQMPVWVQSFVMLALFILVNLWNYFQQNTYEHWYWTCVWYAAGFILLWINAGVPKDKI